MPSEASLTGVLARLSAGPASVEELAADLTPANALRLRRALAWMLKFDLVRLS
jgi:hypothetical protein